MKRYILLLVIHTKNKPGAELAHICGGKQNCNENLITLCLSVSLVGSKLQNSTRHCHQHGVTITRSCIDTICFS